MLVELHAELEALDLLEAQREAADTVATGLYGRGSADDTGGWLSHLVAIAFDSDAMVLTDCENPSVDIPGLTVSLRGLLEIEVSVASAHSDVHSGLWGNVPPDPATTLIALLARLVDEDGRLRLARRDIDPAWLASSRDVPLTDEVVRTGARLLDGVAPLPDRGLTPAAWVWREPAVTVLSTTFPAPGTEKNLGRFTQSCGEQENLAGSVGQAPLVQG